MLKNCESLTATLTSTLAATIIVDQPNHWPSVISYLIFKLRYSKVQQKVSNDDNLSLRCRDKKINPIFLSFSLRPPLLLSVNTFDNATYTNHSLVHRDKPNISKNPFTYIDLGLDDDILSVWFVAIVHIPAEIFSREYFWQHLVDTRGDNRRCDRDFSGQSTCLTGIQLSIFAARQNNRLRRNKNARWH